MVVNQKEIKSRIQFALWRYVVLCLTLWFVNWPIALCNEQNSLPNPLETKQPLFKIPDDFTALPINRVEIRASTSCPAILFRQLIRSKLGDALNRNLILEDLEVIYCIGAISRDSLRVIPSMNGCGISLVFYARDKKLPLPLKLNKFDSFSVSSSDDLEHGEKQVEQMILDRPKMAALVEKGSPVWTWTARQFAGEFTGARIDWSPYLGSFISSQPFPPRDYTSFCSSPVEGTGEQLWARAIFELFNIRNGPLFEDIARRVRTSNMTQEEFVRQTTHLEYDAILQSILFYNTVWKPQFESVGIKTHDEYWGIPIADNFEQWFSKFTNHYYYPWNVYEPLYNRIKMSNRPF